jgi:hypothetical protein
MLKRYPHLNWKAYWKTGIARIVRPGVALAKETPNLTIFAFLRVGNENTEV